MAFKLKGDPMARNYGPPFTKTEHKKTHSTQDDEPKDEPSQSKSTKPATKAAPNPRPVRSTPMEPIQVQEMDSPKNITQTGSHPAWWNQEKPTHSGTVVGAGKSKKEKRKERRSK